jgi:hypothetical protein
MIGLFGYCQNSSAATIGFVENFSTGAADWRDGSSEALDWQSSGGPSGESAVVNRFNFSTATGFGSTSIVFRAQENFGDMGSSQGNFIGDWLGAGVTSISFSVFHDAPQSIDFNVRFTRSVNTPGIISNNFSVPQDEWTEHFIQITPLSIQSISRPPSNFEVAFSDLSRIQISIERPEALATNNTDYNFRLTRVSLIPEPSSGLLSVAASLIFLTRRRRRR